MQVKVLLRTKKQRMKKSVAMVRTTGLEPAQPFDHKNLNLTRLPIPPCPHDSDTILSQIQKNANILEMFLQKVASIGVLRGEGDGI